MSKSAVLKITSKVPKQYKGTYSGVCLTEEGDLYFGMRGPVNGNLCFAVGNCVQKAIPLFQRHGYDEVILDIDAEFTEYKQPAKLKITLL
jgi:hypothetical protein